MGRKAVNRKPAAKIYCEKNFFGEEKSNMKKTNRLISILLSVMMLVSIFPQAAFADDISGAEVAGGDEYTVFVDDACSHPDIKDDERNGICECSVCGKTMVRLTKYDVTDWSISFPDEYYETIDEAIAAVPEFDEAFVSSYVVDDVVYYEYQYSYEVRFYEDIELDHDLEVKDKVFDLAPNTSGYKSKLSFTDGHSMKISRDKINDANAVTLYQIKNIGNITLGKNALVNLRAQPAIDKLILADKTADLRYMADSWYTSEPQLKIKNLEVTAPGCTIGDFINYEDKTLTYRTYRCNDENNRYYVDRYVNDTSVTEISDVTILEAPIQNFTAELDEASKNLVYPGSFTINASSTPSGRLGVSYKAVPPENLSCVPTVTKIDDTNSKFVFDNVSEGTYEIGITATADAFQDDEEEGLSNYIITKYVSVTVSKISVENNDDITVKIKGQDAPCEILYTSGLTVNEEDVKVYDKGTDVTEFFDIEVPQTMLFPNTSYSVTATAKDDGSYKGQISASFTVVKATPVKGVDFNVILPTSLVYDGEQKSVTVVSAKGLEASEIGYAKQLPDESFDIPTAKAPTEAGTYKVYVIINSTPLYNAYNDCAAEFTIEKADVKFEYTNPFYAAYSYESDKKIAGKITNADSSATNAKLPTGTVQITGTRFLGLEPVYSADIALNDDGSFEFELPRLSAGTPYKISVKYSGDDNHKECVDPDSDYTVAVGKTQLSSFNVSNTEHRYAPGVERKITVSSPNSKWLTNDDFDVKYYLVDENSGKLASTEPVNQTISAGRYLYVISLKSEHTNNYGITFEYKVDGNLAIPDTSFYKNTGFMDIKASGDFSQKPISFEKGVVNVKSGEKFTNILKNENASTITYESSDTDVAYVDKNGEVTAKKSGTATITATSTMEGSTPVYASYTVNVKKELTKESFDISVKTKSYDGSKTAVVTAVLKDGFKVDQNDVVKAEITAEFDKADAGERTVSYEITDISGKNADKYILSDNLSDLTGETAGTIEKAVVTVICAKVTTRTFDSNAKSADVSAMANGKIFDTSNYTVKYNGENEAVKVGDYVISIELTESASANYTVEPFDAVLKIVNAAQDIFAVENVPENVYYGDKFTVSAMSANGDVTYEIVNGENIAKINENGEVTIKDVGMVTIKATSKKDGYTDRTAVKTFEAKKRILTPVIKSVGNRKYDGTNTVNVKISFANTADGSDGETDAVGTMVNPDAGNGKIVYVSGIVPADDAHYTLSTSSIQTTVDILPLEITGFTISAADKKYDGTANAQANVDEISGLLSGDKGFVSIIGTAEFDSKDAGADKTVTFTASGLSGAKAQNYTLAATSASANADIEPLKVNFTIGQTTFVYDGKDKEINVSATDENGRIFKGFAVSYNKTPNEADTYIATIFLNDTKNYTTDQGEVAVTIEKATQNQLVIAGLPGTVEYGDSFKLEAFGGADDGTVLWSVTEGKASIADDGTVIIDGTGKIEITATKSSGNYKDISSKVIFTAVAKNITFELDRLEQTFGNVTEIGVSPSDTKVTADDFEIRYNGKTDIPKNAGKYKVEVIATNPNYKGQTRDTLVIARAQAKGKIQINSSFTYGDAISASVTDIPEGTNAKITYAGTGIYIPQQTAPKNAGNYTVIAEITGENYEMLTITKSFAIEKANLRVKAQNTSRAYGEANPVFKLIYDGFINNENESVLLYEPTAAVNANASSAVGKYNVTVSGGYGENYKFIYDNTGELEITGASGENFYITGVSTAYVNDKFTLAAFYGNTKVDAVWKSLNPDIAEIDEKGIVTAKSAGTVTITATADANYKNAEAVFEITVKQAGITLVPTDLVKTYNGERQEISFENVLGFTPVIGQNVLVKYTLITDPTVTEPIKAGTYSVTYTVNDKSFVGGGTTTMYINKANITVIPKDITKVYGDKPKFELAASMQTSLVSKDDLAALAENAKFTCDGAAENANAGQYDITVVLGTYENENLRFTVDGMGTLTVTKAPLTVKVKDVSREYGAENPPLEAEYTGFKNGEDENTENIFTGELSLSYDAEITTQTPVGEYAEKTTASGIESENYEISFVKGSVTITKIGVTASAGTAKASYLTVKLDKALAGLTADNFVIKNGEEIITPKSITASGDNMSYTINGLFKVGTAYSVTVTYEDDTHKIIDGELTITPVRSGSSGGSSGGGSATAVYTVSFDTDGAGSIESVKAEKNSTITEPAAPEKEGYDFAGWYTDKELKEKYDFSSKVTKSFTLYAAWTKKDDLQNQIILTIGKKEAQVFGETKTNDVAPQIVNDRTMLPARFVAENLGADVSWNGEKQLVTITGKHLKIGEDVVILITIGEQSALVNGSEVKLDSPAFVENNRTYTPIRFISEQLGADVTWIEEKQQVVITK